MHVSKHYFHSLGRLMRQTKVPTPHASHEFGLEYRIQFMQVISSMGINVGRQSLLANQIAGT